MRRCFGILTGALLAFGGACHAGAGDNAKAPDAGLRLALAAPVDDVRAAVAERAVFDDVEITFPPTEGAAVLPRAGAPAEERDWVVEQLRRLEKILALRAKLRALSDDELVTRFESACRVPPASSYSEIAQRDPVLLEIVRRGGDAWRDRLRANLEELQEWRKGVTKDGDTRSWDAHDLEVLTALRRVEKKPDPVLMEVTAPEPCAYPDLPTVRVRMVNHDERTVTMTRGGEYRSGREERYGVEARDAKGRLLPSVEWSEFGLGGGMYAREPQATGEGLATALPLGRYVAPLDPGEYSVRIHYSDAHGIADPDEFLGAVTVTSEPFKVRVVPRAVDTTREEQSRLAALAEALPTKGPVEILKERYGPWAHAFVAPETPAGRLLAAGWAALPALVRFVGRPDADPMKRAWAFAVLFGITGRLDPSALNVIGDFETHGGGFIGFTGGGFSKSSRTVTSSARPTIDAAAQDELARAWAKIAAVVELKESKKTARELAAAQMQQLITAIRICYLRRNRVPTTLAELCGPDDDPDRFLDATSPPKDPWGNDFVYLAKDRRTYTLICFGADGVEGGEGDSEDIIEPRPK